MSAKRYGRLCAVVGEGAKSAACAASKNNCKYVFSHVLRVSVTNRSRQHIRFDIVGIANVVHSFR